MNTDVRLAEFRTTLKSEAAIYGLVLDGESLAGLSKYYQLLDSWNSRLHLVAPMSPREFAVRHVLESLLLLPYLPPGTRVADVGSGGGLPIIPCLIARPDINATLVEAAKKKAVFLREALAQTAASDWTVIAERFESIAAPNVNFVTSRALERFEKMLPTLIEWAPDDAQFLLFAGKGLGTRLKEMGLATTATLVPNSEERFLFVFRKSAH